ncbi:hypothetical protein ACHQM5_024098 [Ranunculus cassubicifolius]
MANQNEKKLIPGDVTWVRTRISLWWPAMVVDEKFVSKKLKPKKRSASQVLVREYGSYIYSYVDPVKNYSAFQTILKQNNGSSKEVLEKYMEQDISRIKTGRLKRSLAESRESMADASDEETLRIEKKEKVDSPKPVSST